MLRMYQDSGNQPVSFGHPYQWTATCLIQKLQEYFIFRKESTMTRLEKVLYAARVHTTGRKEQG